MASAAHGGQAIVSQTTRELVADEQLEGVGGRVEMWDSQEGWNFRRLDEAQLARVRNGVEQWQTVESETLDRVVLEEPEPRGEELPEELGEFDEDAALAQE